jgi:hypothetical protein
MAVSQGQMPLYMWRKKWEETIHVLVEAVRNTRTVTEKRIKNLNILWKINLML